MLPVEIIRAYDDVAQLYDEIDPSTRAAARYRVRRLLCIQSIFYLHLPVYNSGIRCAKGFCHICDALPPSAAGRRRSPPNARKRRAGNFLARFPYSRGISSRVSFKDPLYARVHISKNKKRRDARPHARPPPRFSARKRARAAAPPPRRPQAEHDPRQNLKSRLTPGKTRPCRPRILTTWDQARRTRPRRPERRTGHGGPATPYTSTLHPARRKRHRRPGAIFGPAAGHPGQAEQLQPAPARTPSEPPPGEQEQPRRPDKPPGGAEDRRPRPATATRQDTPSAPGAAQEATQAPRPHREQLHRPRRPGAAPARPGPYTGPGGTESAGGGPPARSY